MMPGSSAGHGPEYHVVECCHSQRGDNIFVSFLGYPKSRNCWRSATSHFPTESATPCVKERIRLSVRSKLPDDPLSQTIIQGRVPPVKRLRTMAAVKAAAPSATADQEGRLGGLGGHAAKRPRRKEYESKVHTIRVDSTGVREIRGIRKAGVTIAIGGTSDCIVAADLQDESHGDSKSCPPPAEAATSSNGVTAVAAAASGAAPSANACVSARAVDERSELWRAHRQLNMAALRKPSGSLFRIEVTEIVNSQVVVRWVYPGSSPGDSSAWVGLWDASEFDWPNGEARPKYVRYKALTSSRQEGMLRFGPKELGALPDGVYIFSIDT